MKRHFLVAGVLAICGTVVACGNGDDTASPVPPADGGKGDVSTGAGEAGSDATFTSDVSVPAVTACTTVVNDADCDKTLRPFVFVHGTYGAGDNFAHVASLLTSNGYCADRIVAVEYNSLGDQPGADCTSTAGMGTPQGCGKIDFVVNKILADTGFDKVDIAGHSQGTQHCGVYLGLHANKIAHYINFSGSPDVLNVQTLSLSSMHDLMGTPHHAITSTGSICAAPGDGGAPEASAADAGSADSGAAPPCNVTQVTFTNQDHFAVAASKDSFIQVYKYLNGKDPKYTEVQCGEDPVTIEGVAETFADNVPVMGKVEVREVTTPRASGSADMTLLGDAKGHFTGQLKRNAFYEFAGYDAAGKLVGYQYFTPFKRTNRLVRLLSPASKSDGATVYGMANGGGLIAAASTDKATRIASASTVVVRWAGGAFRQDLGASLKLNGAEILTTENAGTQALMNGSLNGGVVGLFLEDKNKNGKTDLGLVDETAFIAFTDVFIDAKTPNFVGFSLTPGSEDPTIVGTQAVISNYPSSGAIISVFFQ
jgi:pimeloyl-ACP methyl ester carboxylesterase